MSNGKATATAPGDFVLADPEFRDKFPQGHIPGQDLLTEEQVREIVREEFKLLLSGLNAAFRLELKKIAEKGIK